MFDYVNVSVLYSNQNCRLIKNLEEVFVLQGSEGACDGFREFDTKTVSARYV